MTRLIGIDFSGDAKRWSGGTTRSNVWIAEAESSGEIIQIYYLYRVQKLGSDRPFDRLIDFLNDAHGAYAGIDAPFSLPKEFLVKQRVPPWQLSEKWPKDGRPFAKGQQLVSYFLPSTGKYGDKSLRTTECYWRDQKINVRSALWCGPRGGAPFAAACFTLLARHNGPIWPFRDGGQGATLCEAFPAAQLRHWGMQHDRYNRVSDSAARKKIINSLRSSRGLQLNEEMRRNCENSADALDAVLCVYAAQAVASNSYVGATDQFTSLEGHIAVFSNNGDVR